MLQRAAHNVVKFVPQGTASEQTSRQQILKINAEHIKSASDSFLGQGQAKDYKDTKPDNSTR